MGDPVALARARHGQGRVYDSQKHIKLAWGIDLARLHDDEPYFDGPIQLDAVFYLPIPSSRSQTKQQQTRNSWHISKPDASNLIKFVEDVACKICYHDDSIICRLIIEKRYDDGHGTRTELTLTQLH